MNMLVKFTQNEAGATASINDGQEIYYTRWSIDTAKDVDRIVRDFAAKYDGGGFGDVTANITVLRSRSRKYPAGAQMKFSF